MTNQISKLIAHVVSTIGSEEQNQNEQNSETSDNEEDFCEDEINMSQKSDKKVYHDMRGSFNRRREANIDPNDLVIQNNFD